MSRCEAPWLEPCTADADGVSMFEGEPILTCPQCRRDLGDFETYHFERDPLADPLAAFQSWWGKP
jgi:hypothetical protein